MTTAKIVKELSDVCEILDSTQKELAHFASSELDDFDRGYDMGASDEAKMIYLRLKALIKEIHGW